MDTITESLPSPSDRPLFGEISSRPLFGAGPSATARGIFFGKTNQDQNSSASLLAAMKDRKQTLLLREPQQSSDEENASSSNQYRDSTHNKQPDQTTYQQSSSILSDPTSREALIIRILDYMNQVGGSANSKEIMDHFALKLSQDDLPVLRQMLRRLATFEKPPPPPPVVDGQEATASTTKSQGKWTLRPEFLKK